MKFPFTYHSKSDHRLICVNFDDQYQVLDMEVWDELHDRWLPIPHNSPSYPTYLSEFPADHNQFLD